MLRMFDKKDQSLQNDSSISEIVKCIRNKTVKKKVISFLSLINILSEKKINKNEEYNNAFYNMVISLKALLKENSDVNIQSFKEKVLVWQNACKAVEIEPSIDIGDRHVDVAEFMELMNPCSTFHMIVMAIFLGMLLAGILMLAFGVGGAIPVIVNGCFFSAIMCIVLLRCQYLTNLYTPLLVEAKNALKTKIEDVVTCIEVARANNEINLLEESVDDSASNTPRPVPECI